MARIPIDFSDPEADLVAAQDYVNRLAPMQSDEEIAIQQLNQANAPLEWFPAIREGIVGAKKLVTGENRLSSGTEIMGKLTGNEAHYDPETQQWINKPVERYQTWPEQMVRSGGSLPADVYSGRIPVMQGEHTNPELIERTQDLAGMAGGGFAAKPNAVVAAAKSSELAPLAALEHAPRFYSALENAVKNSKTKVASAEQWLGELRNQPGVKAEELDWVLHDLPKGNLTKSELEQFVNEHKVELKEVNKGKVPLRVEPLEDEPHILQIFRANDPTGEVSGMVGEIIKKENVEGKEYYQVNVPGLDRKKYFGSQKEAEDYISERTDFGTQTKFHGYQLPGGENYREHLLMLPSNKIDPAVFAKQFYDTWVKRGGDLEFEQLSKAKQEDWIRLAGEQSSMGKGPNDFQSSHWDEPNLLAHIRTNERVIPPVAGGRNEPLNSLHIEEIQSDWHQKGRKEGYKGEKEDLQPKFDAIENKILASNDESVMANPELKDALKLAVDKSIITADEAKTYARYSAIESGAPVPDAPFKSNWADLALKRIIRQAAEEGKDSISWTPGEAQAARYPEALRQRINNIDWVIPDTATNLKDVFVKAKEADQSFRLTVNDKGKIIDATSAGQQLISKNLSDAIGKDMSNRILNEKEGRIKDFVIGAEPMKAFYDKMLVDKANAIAKKFGGKVEQGNLPEGYKGEVYEREGGPFIGNTRNQIDLDNARAQGKFVKLDQKEQPIHVLRITPQLRDAALHKGFSLFADTGKVGAPLAALTKVDHNPFKLGELEKQHGVKLTPVDVNPFTTDAYHGAPGPFVGNKIGDNVTVNQNSNGSWGVYYKGRQVSPDYPNKEIANAKYLEYNENIFFSAKNHKLAGGNERGQYGYANPTGIGVKGSVMPLKLNIKDYHTVNANGKSWQEINDFAIEAAEKLGKKGVIVNNVIDNPSALKDYGPQTVYITLDPSTVRSRFAKFDPAKFHESGLLKASGLPVYSDDKGNQLIPPPPNPARIAALEPPEKAIATIAAKAGEWGLFALARNSPRLFATLNAAWGAQLPAMINEFMMDDIRKQVREGKSIADIKFEEGGLADMWGILSSLEKKYGKSASKLRPVVHDPFK